MKKRCIVTLKTRHFILFFLNFQYLVQHKAESLACIPSLCFVAVACLRVCFKYLKNLKILENSSSILKKKINIKSDLVRILHLEILFCLSLRISRSHPWPHIRITQSPFEEC